jgi:1-deoxy-D-xylulose-5-phosphate synthase
MHYMAEKMPERTFDVGIAEQHAVTFSAGAATEGFIPFCNIYSSFLQRAYDQVIHDVALQKLPVVFCIDRGGLVGEDGPTHHGVFDFAYLRCIPNITIAAPMNEVELRNMMYTAQLGENGPFTIRYPRGGGVLKDWKQAFEKLEIGKGRLINEGHDLALLSIGDIGNSALKAAHKAKEEGISAALYDMRFVKPLDKALLDTVFSQFDKIITIENGVKAGGFGSAILEYAAEQKYKGDLHLMGVADEFVPHGCIGHLNQLCHLDDTSILERIKEINKLP